MTSTQILFPTLGIILGTLFSIVVYVLLTWLLLRWTGVLPRRPKNQR